MTKEMISGNYRKLEASEVSQSAMLLDSAWQNAAIPMRQWIGVTRQEVAKYREGHEYVHFSALIELLRYSGQQNPTLLDVGASSGFYSEILKIGGFPCRYTGLDYSAAYKHMAEELYPGIDFHVGDARALPFEDGAFEIVLSGCVIMHVADYERVIAESARVASKFVVLNRTPVLMYSGVRTEFYEKEAYGVKTLEIHFCEAELHSLFKKYGMESVLHRDCFEDVDCHYRSRSYLLRKVPSA